MRRRKSNELMAHATHLYGIPSQDYVLLFMDPMVARIWPILNLPNCIEGRAIDVFNNGEMQRDFTYIDDIIEGIMRLLPKAPEVQRPDTSNAEALLNYIILAITQLN